MARSAGSFAPFGAGAALRRVLVVGAVASAVVAGSAAGASAAPKSDDDSSVSTGTSTKGTGGVISQGRMWA